MKRIAETDLYYIVDPRPIPRTWIGRVLRAAHDYLSLKNERCWRCDELAAPGSSECRKHEHAGPM